MILMMNKNFPAYMSFVLEDQGLPKEFVAELIHKSCCQTKAKEIHLCSWDSDTRTLLTPKDKSNTSPERLMVQASWFKDTFADLNLTKRGKGKLPAPPPECLYNLARDNSVGTIHDKNMAPFQEGKSSKDTVNLAGSDEESASSSEIFSVPLPARAAPTEDYTSTSSSEEEDGDGSQDAAGGG